MEENNHIELENFKTQLKALNLEQLEAYKEFLWCKYHEVKAVIQFKKEMKELDRL